jgi:hypothetical protein
MARGWRKEINCKTEYTSMIAGAYEVVALEQPLMLTNWLPLKPYFNKGTLYIDNSSDDIRNAAMVARTKKEELSRDTST